LTSHSWPDCFIVLFYKSEVSHVFNLILSNQKEFNLALEKTFQKEIDDIVVIRHKRVQPAG